MFFPPHHEFFGLEKSKVFISFFTDILFQTPANPKWRVWHLPYATAETDRLNPPHLLVRTLNEEIKETGKVS